MSGGRSLTSHPTLLKDLAHLIGDAFSLRKLWLLPLAACSSAPPQPSPTPARASGPAAIPAAAAAAPTPAPTARLVAIAREVCGYVDRPFASSLAALRTGAGSGGDERGDHDAMQFVFDDDADIPSVSLLGEHGKVWSTAVNVLRPDPKTVCAQLAQAFGPPGAATGELASHTLCEWRVDGHRLKLSMFLEHPIDGRQPAVLNCDNGRDE